jgi:hypothetical protein
VLSVTHGDDPIEMLPNYVDAATAPVRAGQLAAGPAGSTTVLIDRHADFAEHLPEWLSRDRRPPQLGSDQTVRRVLWTSFTAAVGALADCEHDLVIRPTTVRGRACRHRRPLARLLLTRITHRTGDLLAWEGALQVHLGRRALPVDVVLEPWSAERTEVRIQVPADGFRIRLPSTYFDAAHALVDRLRFEIEVRGGEVPARQEGHL